MTQLTMTEGKESPSSNLSANVQALNPKPLIVEAMLPILKCPPSNPLGFICLSHKTFAWFTG